jgi:hypothetical protein
LHVGLASVVFFHYIVSLVQLLSECVDFLTVVGSNTLNFTFHCLLEIILILLHSPFLPLLLPSLEDLSCHLLFKLLPLVLKDFARVFLPVAVLLEGQEASQLQTTHSGHYLTLTGPESKNFCSNPVLVSFPRFLS